MTPQDYQNMIYILIITAGIFALFTVPAWVRYQLYKRELSFFLTNRGKGLFYSIIGSTVLWIILYFTYLFLHEIFNQ